MRFQDKIAVKRALKKLWKHYFLLKPLSICIAKYLLCTLATCGVKWRNRISLVVFDRVATFPMKLGKLLTADVMLLLRSLLEFEFMIVQSGLHFDLTRSIFSYVKELSFSTHCQFISILNK